MNLSHFSFCDGASAMLASVACDEREDDISLHLYDTCDFNDFLHDVLNSQQNQEFIYLLSSD